MRKGWFVIHLLKLHLMMKKYLEISLLQRIWHMLLHKIDPIQCRTGEKKFQIDYKYFRFKVIFWNWTKKCSVRNPKTDKVLYSFWRSSRKSIFCNQDFMAKLKLCFVNLVIELQQLLIFFLLCHSWTKIQAITWWHEHWENYFKKSS